MNKAPKSNSCNSCHSWSISWRDQILKEFIPKVARLTLVADPDGLLLEEEILADIRERGFELIPFDDPVAFRYAYESRFRSSWDKGEDTDLVVVLRSQTSDLNGLPYDFLQAGRRLSFNLGDIFPNLSYPVVADLDRGDLDALYEAQKRHAPGHLGDNGTKEFVLRHVFEIAPELIKKQSDLLRVLIRLHYRGQRIPSELAERFIAIMRQNPQFDEWPLEILVSDREVFFTFLQERWPIFLNRAASNQTSSPLGETLEQTKIRETEKSFLHPQPGLLLASSLSVPGPVDLPFDHHDIRIYIDNFFTEGMLQAVQHEHADTLSKTWAGIGVRTAPLEDKSRRLNKLIDSLKSTIPSEDAKYTQWLHFARGWAEMIFLVSDQTDTISEALSERIKNMQKEMDVSFADWLSRRYASLVYLPPEPPVMLHHLPRFLARQLEDGCSKVALIVVDGLAMDQWLVVRKELMTRKANLCFREEAVFAWMPTITSVSRQATFAGRAPVYFPNSIQSTEKESALWTHFWEDQGFKPNEVLYIKGLGDDDSLETVSEALSHPKARVAGLVVDKVDKIMHGMELGTAGMHNQVCQWVRQGYLNGLLTLLLDQGFKIYLTSDHGNVEAIGCGRPGEGAVADLRGERVRIYADTLLRLRIRDSYPDATEWPVIGLPQHYYPLIAPHRKAFIGIKERIVSHGGCSLEELIVPFVHIERKK